MLQAGFKSEIIHFFLRYTNADNPFGDGNLLDTFVWHKKLEKQGLQDLATSEKKKMIKQKQESNKIELAKVVAAKWAWYHVYSGVHMVQTFVYFSQCFALLCSVCTLYCFLMDALLESS